MAKSSKRRRFADCEVDEDQCPFALGPKERVPDRYAQSGYSYTRSCHLDDVEFDNCTFIGESLVTRGSSEHRSTARRVRMTNVKVNVLDVIGAVLDEVFVEGLRASVHPIRVNGCALRHVVLSGVCGRFLLSPDVRLLASTSEDLARNAAFTAANIEYYRNVDWALDLSQAKVACFENRGAIPAHLIRRNPNEQFLMTREVAASGKWKKFEPPSATAIGISMFESTGGDVELFVAASRSKGFKEEVEFFHRLKANGLVS